MIKYVLNSGGFRDKPELAEKFFTEIVKGLGNKPRFLICQFAQAREDWEKNFQDSRTGFFKFPQDVEPTFELAMPDIFERQVKNSDVIYIHGGDDHLVQYWLRQFDLPGIWDNKVVATSSASANALAKHFWTRDWRQCMDGLGLLPIKFIPHHESSFGADDPRGPIDWAKAHEELKSYGDPELPIHALKEGYYIVIEQ